MITNCFIGSVINKLISFILNYTSFLNKQGGRDTFISYPPLPLDPDYFAARFAFLKSTNPPPARLNTRMMFSGNSPNRLITDFTSSSTVLMFPVKLSIGSPFLHDDHAFFIHYLRSLMSFLLLGILAVFFIDERIVCRTY